MLALKKAKRAVAFGEKESLIIQVILLSLRSYNPNKQFLGNYHMQMHYILSQSQICYLDLKPVTNMVFLLFSVHDLK